MPDAKKKGTPAAKKPATKKAAAKKSTPAKKSPAAKKPAGATAKERPLLEKARKILPLLKSGKTTLGAERDKLGLNGNGPLRKALTELLGSKKAYAAMMAAARKNKVA